MQENTPNQNEEGTVTVPNPSETGTETTVNNDFAPAEGDIDYRTKFSESSREALKLLDEKKQALAEVERLKALVPKDDGTSYSNESDGIPGFETLGEDEQRNLLEYTKSIEDRTLQRIYKDPALAFAKETYNEKRWDDAYGTVAKDFPELSKDEFKEKYFKKGVNVPENIGDMLKDFAKIELFDKARDLGARDAKEQNDRLDVERAKGGEKTPTASRTTEDWTRLAQENPAKFAQLSKQFDEDMASGKLK